MSRDSFDIEVVDKEGKHTYIWHQVQVDGKYITFACPNCREIFIIKKTAWEEKLE